MLREKVVKSFNFLCIARISKLPTPTNTSYPFQQAWQFKQYLALCLTASRAPLPPHPLLLHALESWVCSPRRLPPTPPPPPPPSPQPYHHSLPHSWPSLPFITSLMVMNSAPSPPSTIYSFLHLCSGWKKVQDTSYCAPSITKCPPALPEILSLINVLALKGQPNWIKFWTSLNTTFLTNRRSWKNKTKGSCYLLNTA